MTIEQLKQIIPNRSITILDTFIPHLNIYMPIYDINTPARQAAFIANVAHESGGFKWVRELWGPTEAQKKYENRADLGNTVSGDGSKFRGRGLIQITGRKNYTKLSVALTKSERTFTDTPELLTAPCYAVESATWFWKTNGLNELADNGEFEKITRRINGGLNGYAERIEYYNRALIALGV